MYNGRQPVLFSCRHRGEHIVVIWDLFFLPVINLTHLMYIKMHMQFYTHFHNNFKHCEQNIFSFNYACKYVKHVSYFV
jgi:hypothetical protein